VSVWRGVARCGEQRTNDGALLSSPLLLSLVSFPSRSRRTIPLAPLPLCRASSPSTRCRSTTSTTTCGWSSTATYGLVARSLAHGGSELAHLVLPPPPPPRRCTTSPSSPTSIRAALRCWWSQVARMLPWYVLCSWSSWSLLVVVSLMRQPQDFDNVGHSDDANEMMKKYLIGTLKV